MIKRLLCVIALLGMAQDAAAQSLSGRTFIDLNTGFSIADNSFTDIWEPSTAVQLSVRVPFYAGQLEGGTRYIRFTGDAPTQTDSDFHSVFLHLGWSYPISVTPRFRIAPTLRFGNNLMLFDEAEVFTNQSGTQRFVTDKTESEFTYELALRNQFQISEHWHAHATLSYNRTLTFFPLSVPLISAGITYAFDTPRWLKHVLK